MKKQFSILLLISACFFSFVGQTFAAPVINEFSSGEGSDWIEIYNPDDATYDLSTLRIRDLTENNKLDLTESLPGKSFIVFDWSNKLNNGGDVVKLVLISDNSIIDQISYGDQGGILAPDSSQTAGRKSDGDSEWVLFVSNSKGTSNSSTSLYTPPSPTPTKIPTPTKTLAPTKIPTVKSGSTSTAKTPTPVKSVTVSQKASSPVDSSNSGGEFAKISETIRSASHFAVIKPVSDTQEKKDVRVLGAKDENGIPFVLISGVLFLASGALIFTRKLLKEKGIL